MPRLPVIRRHLLLQCRPAGDVEGRWRRECQRAGMPHPRVIRRICSRRPGDPPHLPVIRPAFALAWNADLPVQIPQPCWRRERQRAGMPHLRVRPPNPPCRFGMPHLRVVRRHLLLQCRPTGMGSLLASGTPAAGMPHLPSSAESFPQIRHAAPPCRPAGICSNAGSRTSVRRHPVPVRHLPVRQN